MPLKDPWSESDRYVPRTVVQPIQRVLAHEAAGGVVMLIAAAIAIIWANSPWADSYAEVWQGLRYSLECNCTIRGSSSAACST